MALVDEMTRLVIRADASATIGIGHVMRSLAVAEVARDCGVDILWIVGDAGAGAELVSRHGFAPTLCAWGDPVGWTTALRPSDTVLVDAYHLGREAFDAVRHRGARSCAVDSIGTGWQEADVVICADSDVPPSGVRPGSVALCGLPHALVRHEFLRFRRLRAREFDCLAVCLGGGDPCGLVPVVLDILDEVRPASRVVLLAGPHVPVPSEAPRSWLEVHRNPDQVAAVLDQADAAISGGGTTALELMCMGIPAALIKVADNQDCASHLAATTGAAIYVGEGKAGAHANLAGALRALAPTGERRRLSQAALAAVDGRGPERVARAILAPG
ncbi:MAG: hypothetical protein E6J14_02850 [Chloroflexi bacterium]|nr:MAG: hypothetical protein E6J14_02850 [Chloroflexota bacterium]